MWPMFRKMIYVGSPYGGRVFEMKYDPAGRIMENDGSSGRLCVVREAGQEKECCEGCHIDGNLRSFAKETSRAAE